MSKDERYDVSQHNGITPGPWTNAPMIGTVVQGVRAGEDAKERAFDGHDPDYQLLFAAPDILNALKKAYEEIDKSREDYRRVRAKYVAAMDYVVEGYAYCEPCQKGCFVEQFTDDGDDICNWCDEVIKTP